MPLEEEELIDLWRTLGRLSNTLIQTPTLIIYVYYKEKVRLYNWVRCMKRCDDNKTFIKKHNTLNLTCMLLSLWDEQLSGWRSSLPFSI